MSQINHDFMPITTGARLQAALEYIAEAVPLARAALGHELSVDVLCLFAQSNEEHAFIEPALLARGRKSSVSHGPTTYVEVDLVFAGHRINLLGVRRPDPTRLWVGYADYPAVNYDEMLKGAAGNPHAHEIQSGRSQPLIELCHPDFDTLGFIHDPTWKSEQPA